MVGWTAWGRGGDGRCAVRTVSLSNTQFAYGSSLKAAWMTSTAPSMSAAVMGDTWMSMLLLLLLWISDGLLLDD